MSACIHVHNKLAVPTLEVTAKSIAENSRAEMNEHMKLCGICAANLILFFMECEGKKPK